MTKRLFDLAASLLLLCPAAPVIAVVALFVKFTSRGPILYGSDRVGQNNELFHMYKFRTMQVGAPETATHLLEEAEQWLTPVGPALRRLSLDELPQLWHVLRGQMSLVGPRPALHSQLDLIGLRSEAGVQRVRPGITGLAQIRGRDSLLLEEKVEFDRQYSEEASLILDLKILVKTVASSLGKNSVHEGDATSAIPCALLRSGDKGLLLVAPSRIAKVTSDPAAVGWTILSFRPSFTVANLANFEVEGLQVRIAAGPSCDENLGPEVETYLRSRYGHVPAW